jgi:hypothetical protein
MTPKEKAEKLVLKYLMLQQEGSSNWFHKILAKKCALIAVDELINNDFAFETFESNSLNSKYWYKVQNEIQKL